MQRDSFLRSDREKIETTQEELFQFLTYQCSNCRKSHKIYAVGLAIKTTPDGYRGSGAKFGELPSFGPPTPSRLIKLIGPDREVFLKGRQCENQGLGIGAFIYYRRVVENQKSRILEAIRSIAEKVKMPTSKTDLIDMALKEQQFSKAVDIIKDAIPESLLIDGHNPLKLLHSALSKGVHDHSDSECLSLAQNVRVVLAELSDRISMALKDEHELKSAVSALLKLEK